MRQQQSGRHWAHNNPHHIPATTLIRIIRRQQQQQAHLNRIRRAVTSGN